MNKTALIVGASGLVGGHLLELLLANKSFSQVFSLVRKASNKKHKKLVELVFDFNDDLAYNKLPKTDVAFCCLGTTIKKTGSQAAFKKVDWEYPLKLAKALKKDNANSFHIITSLGSDAQSLIFYSRVKGELENDLKKLDFKYLSIYQPSLLLGNRQEKKWGENFAISIFPRFDFLLQGGLKKYRAIEAEDVAKGMIYGALNETNNIQTYLSDEIKDMADKLHTID